jgi:hypothetical protein
VEARKRLENVMVRGPAVTEERSASSGSENETRVVVAR